MGASGAGKTTLMDVLAGRKTGALGRLGKNGGGGAPWLACAASRPEDAANGTRTLFPPQPPTPPNSTQPNHPTPTLQPA